MSEPREEFPEPRDRAYKRPFDLLLLVAAYAALLPIWIVLWVLIPALIWLGDRGPIFYTQMRMGRRGIPFKVRKFRTMVVGADAIGPAWNSESDPRVTSVGRFLRRTALDEIPSLLSILSGQMSFVGPRALAVEEHRLLEEQIPGFANRLSVRPGLTGYSQVFNRENDDAEKLRHDLHYISSAGLLLDVILIVRSCVNTLFARWDTRRDKE